MKNTPKTYHRFSVLEKYTNQKVRRTIKGHYKFIIGQTLTLPIQIKRRKLISPHAKVLRFDYTCSDHIASMGIYINKKFKTIRNIDISKHWNTISFDLSEDLAVIEQNILRNDAVCLRLQIVPLPTSPAVKIKIKNIRLDSRTLDEQKKSMVRESYRERREKSLINLYHYYHYAEFCCGVTSVRVFENSIEICGDIGYKEQDFMLCEIPMFVDFSGCNFVPVQPLSSEDGHFRVSTARYAKKIDGHIYDRILSRWAVTISTTDGYSLCSYGKYADHIDCEYGIPKPIHLNKKGLGAFKYNEFESDLDELGISYITLNMRINNFLRLKPEKDAIPFEYGGCTYYANAMKIAKYDRAIQSAAKRGIDVSAIILVYPENRSRDKDVGRLLEHPEFDPAGAYTMPNMTNQESLNLYAAAVDFLASRYSRPDKKYGHVHRWIVHNEVDAGWVWANAGEKNILEYMDIYHKSIRLVYLITLKYNRNTEVLISLTHFWSIPNIEPFCYPASYILNELISFSRAEGDFRWGIAHHPYPENLADPRSWSEPNATFNGQTKVITFKNLEVLNAWIKQPETFYQGGKRTLLLSEQNPNSPDYTDRSLIEQAACLAYAWKKVMACDGIDAYIAHSWIDARFEGGLKTGLRKYPDDESDPFGCKPSWYLYRDLATERETESCEFAKKIIGIEDWDEIIHMLKAKKN